MTSRICDRSDSSFMGRPANEFGLDCVASRSFSLLEDFVIKIQIGDVVSGSIYRRPLHLGARNM